MLSPKHRSISTVCRYTIVIAGHDSVQNIGQSLLLCRWFQVICFVLADHKVIDIYCNVDKNWTGKQYSSLRGKKSLLLCRSRVQGQRLFVSKREEISTIM